MLFSFNITWGSETFDVKGVTLHIPLDWWVLCLFMEKWCKRFTLCRHRGYLTLVENLIHIWNNFSEAVNSSIIKNNDSNQASYPSRLIITLIELTVSGFLSQVYIFEVKRFLISWRESYFCQSCFHWRFSYRDIIKIGFSLSTRKEHIKVKKKSTIYFFYLFIFFTSVFLFSYLLSSNLIIHIFSNCLVIITFFDCKDCRSGKRRGRKNICSFWIHYTVYS